MMMMASSIVVGHWAIFVPLMIGRRRMAYPRIEAFSLWTFVAGYFVIFSAVLRWVPNGLDGLRTAPDPGRPRHDLLPLRIRRDQCRHDGGRVNLAATIINYRAPG